VKFNTLIAPFQAEIQQVEYNSFRICGFLPVEILPSEPTDSAYWFFCQYSFFLLKAKHESTCISNSNHEIGAFLSLLGVNG